MNDPSALASGVKAYLAELDRADPAVVAYTHNTLARLYDRHGEDAVQAELQNQLAAIEAAKAPAREEHRRKAYTRLMGETN
jgi:hypothetical protein